MTKCAGPQPGEETCELCTPKGTFGLAPVDDRRFLGGHVSSLLRHDPLIHADDCPKMAWIVCPGCEVRRRGFQFEEGDYLCEVCRKRA